MTGNFQVAGRVGSVTTLGHAARLAAAIRAELASRRQQVAATAVRVAATVAGRPVLAEDAGHEFHGNQWTDIANKFKLSLPKKVKEVLKDARLHIVNGLKDRHGNLISGIHQIDTESKASVIKIDPQYGNVGETIAHEFGHAYHRPLLRIIKGDGDFTDAFLEDLKNLPEKYKSLDQGSLGTFGPSYYASSNREAFAEAFAGVHYKGKYLFGLPREEGEKAFPKSLASMKKLTGAGMPFEHKQIQKSVKASELLTDVDETDTEAAPEPVASASASRTHAVEVATVSAQMVAVGNWIMESLAARVSDLETALVQAVTGNDPNQDDCKVCFQVAQQAIEKAFGAARDYVARTLDEVAAAAEHRIATSDVENHGEPLVDGAVNVTDMTIVGLTLEEHFQAQAATALLRFKAAVRQGVKAGETPEQIALRVTGTEPDADAVTASEPVTAAKRGKKAYVLELPRLADATENSLEKVIQAAMTEIGNAVREHLERKGVLPGAAKKNFGMEWVAVLDTKTCPACEHLDGQRWNLAHENVSGGSDWNGGPPRHYGCRCALVKVNLDAPAAGVNTVDDLLKNMSKDKQEKTFGKQNLRQYRGKHLTAAQIVAQRGRSMTPGEFKAGGKK